MPTFEDEIRQAINRHSKENASNTPDWILAQFLLSCLDAWNAGVQQRETWYGRDARPYGGFESIPDAKEPAKRNSFPCEHNSFYTKEEFMTTKRRHCQTCDAEVFPFQDESKLDAKEKS